MDIKISLLIITVIGYIIYYLVRFYLKVRSLPPGPTPWPIVGNIQIIQWKHWTEMVNDWAKRYGPVFTGWVGTEPVVTITDIDIGRECFKKMESAGRPHDIFAQLMNTDKHSDVAFNDYGSKWEAMRKVAHSAILKYSTYDKLIDLAIESVDHTIETMIEREGLDTPFVPLDYIYNMFLNIVAANIYGESYHLDDPEYKKVKYIQRDIFTDLNDKIMFWHYIPIASIFFDRTIRKFKESFEKHLDIFISKFQDHYKDHSESVVRDICDNIITAKHEAIRESRRTVPYLTDSNLAMACFDMLIGGTDTSSGTFAWMLLHMIYYEEVATELRREVDSVIGDRKPTHDDRSHCHYVMAFISEVLRMKNTFPQGLIHKTIAPCRIGRHMIEKGTSISLFQGYIMNDEKHWDRAKQFRPERFLDSDGKFLTTRPKAFIPFGVGRRVCLGERLAITNIFFILVRLIQKTSNYKLSLECETDVFDADPNTLINLVPKPFKIIIANKL